MGFLFLLVLIGILGVVTSSEIKINYDPLPLEIVPYPLQAVTGQNAAFINPSEFSISLDCKIDCDIIKRAIDRYSKIIFKSPGSTGMVYRESIFEDKAHLNSPTGLVTNLFTLQIRLTATVPATLELGMDESYHLTVDDEKSLLESESVWGILRGLESFSQLVKYQTIQSRTGYSISYTPISITDRPRFPWRGLLIDSSRHYLTPKTLRRTIDTMAAMKLNTLHWHIVDAESFPFQSQAYPDLQAKATYHPSASYSPSLIQGLVEYARDRGVRIVPEFDTPGHSAAVGQAYPSLTADCWDWMRNRYSSDKLRWSNWDNVALDVTREDTHTFASTLLKEMSQSFPDSFFHIGGDEVIQGCWSSVPSILQYMQVNGFASQPQGGGDWTYDFDALQGNWTSFIQNRVSSLGRQAVVWDEAFSLGFPLRKDTVVQIWHDDLDGSLLKSVVQSGHRALLSSGWYLDRQEPITGHANWLWVWSGRDMYGVDPLPANSTWTPTPEERERVIGGEAASWGESVDDKNFDARVWTRIPGVAERLWSSPSLTDPWSLQPRISLLACRLALRGVMIGDSSPAFCDYYPPEDLDL